MMLMDGDDGDTVSSHQPGYRFADADSDGREQAARAYTERSRRVADAWKSPSPLPETDS